MERTSHRGSAALVLSVLVAFGASGAGATHDDGTYDHPVLYERSTAELDVAVLLDPLGSTPAFESATSDMLEHWQAAIDHFAAPWLRDGLVLRIFVIGSDPAPPAGFGDPEILVTNIPGYVAPSTNAGGSWRCVATSTAFPYDYEETWRVIAHEFGHCLGLNHTGDGNNPATYHPFEDMMSYGPDEDLECVSNLNVRALERVYGALFGQPGGGAASVPIAEYEQLPCQQYGP